MLELRNIAKTFNAQSDYAMKLYENFNLHVEKGEFLVVIGSNGSGKSTLLNLICGQVNPDQGELDFKGKNLKRLKSFQRFREVSRVYQDPGAGTSPSLSVFENLSMAYHKGRLFNLRKGMEDARRDFFKEQLRQLNLGLEHKLDVKVANLSGGQRQAISLLMALLNQPDLLLLDEHTAALDPKNSEIIMKLTDSLIRNNEITTIMVTHNLQQALDYGSRLVMFHAGKIIADYSQEEKKDLKREDLISLFMTFEGSYQG